MTSTVLWSNDMYYTPRYCCINWAPKTVVGAIESVASFIPVRTVCISPKLYFSIFPCITCYMYQHIIPMLNSTYLWQLLIQECGILNRMSTDMYYIQFTWPFQCGNRIYAYANRLDPGQPPSNSAAGLRANLFATQSIISNTKQAESKGFKKQTTI